MTDVPPIAAARQERLKLEIATKSLMREMTTYRSSQDDPTTNQLQQFWGRRNREEESAEASGPGPQLSSPEDDAPASLPETIEDPFDLAFLPWPRPTTDPPIDEGDEAQR